MYKNTTYNIKIYKLYDIYILYDIFIILSCPNVYKNYETQIVNIHETQNIKCKIHEAQNVKLQNMCKT